MSTESAPERDGLCPHGRPWDDCYGNGGHPVFASGDGSGLPGPMGHPNLAFCRCGSAWFRALVAMEQDGRITSYTELVCADCGEAKPLGFTGDNELQWSTPEWREEHNR